MNKHEKMLIMYARGAEYEARDYSGRFMFGKQCLGYSVESDRDFLVDLLSYAARSYFARGADWEKFDDWNRFCSLLRSMRVDTLGLNLIVYFPSVSWDECVEVMDQGD